MDWRSHEWSLMGNEQRVLDGPSWLFDQHLLALEEFDSNTVPTHMAFT